MTIGYHDIEVGMVFEEMGAKGRRVTVTDSGIYSVLVRWRSKRGIERAMSVPRKRLSNPELWSLAEPESKGET